LRLSGLSITKLDRVTQKSRELIALLGAESLQFARGQRAVQTYLMQLSADQIVEETREWPEDAVADLVDRIMRAKYGDADPAIERAWRDEIQRRMADMEGGKVQGIPIEETLAKARTISGQ
jgi:putative addiction module component (TIGR02574 family)